MESITFKNYGVPWELYTLQISIIFSLGNFKETSHIDIFKHFQIFIVDILIYFYSGKKIKRNN